MEISSTLRQAILDYRKGNKEAFTCIYKESEKYIYSCIYKVAKGNDDAYDMTADVMSDTYLEISQKIDTLDDVERFLSWAGTIATRKCYAYIKKNKKEVLIGEEDTTFDDLVAGDNIIPEEVMQNREAQRLLREIIDTELNEMQKLCIIGVYYNEQKQSEIAKELGIPENTVKTHLSRAKARIKAGVEELNMKKGTRLFSVAPIIMLLFKEDIQACEVPAQIGNQVLGIVGSSALGAGTIAGAKGGATGIKGLIAKITGASTKAKIIGAAATVGVAGTTGAVVYNMNTNNWQHQYTEYLTTAEDTDRFDLHDFDGDGVPELVCSNDKNDFWIYTCKSNKVKNVVSWLQEDTGETLYDRHGGKYDTLYGYGPYPGILISMHDGILNFDDYDSSREQELWGYYYDNDELNQTMSYEIVMLDESQDFTRENCETIEKSMGDNGFEQHTSLLNANHNVKYYAFTSFVEIEYSILNDSSTISQVIRERIKEFENNGNRDLTPSGIQFYGDSGESESNNKIEYEDYFIYARADQSTVEEVGAVDMQEKDRSYLQEGVVLKKEVNFYSNDGALWGYAKEGAVIDILFRSGKWLFIDFDDGTCTNMLLTDVEQAASGNIGPKDANDADEEMVED